MSLEGGGNIGNYKGVMLCNRPFAGISAPSKSSSVGEVGAKPAFAVGKPHSELGLNPVRKDDLFQGKREKKDSALSKHKKWLRELQKERQRLDEELKENAKKKEERTKRFEEKQAEMRKTYKNEEKESEEPISNNSEQKHERKKKESKKPMWALTEGGAEKQVEIREEEEADELLDFVKDLDFDAYEEEMEARTVMDAIDKRVKMIEEEVQKEEKELASENQTEDQEGGMPTAENKPMTLSAENLSKYSKGDGGKEVDDDAVSVASTILSEAKELRHIHSGKSVAALARRAKEKLHAIEEDFDKDFPSRPKVVVIDEDKGVRLNKNKDVSNLPYMHRNPAV